MTERTKGSELKGAAARELRDRWLEQVNAGAYAIGGAGKYDLSRMIDANAARPTAVLDVPVRRSLPAAA